MRFFPIVTVSFISLFLAVPVFADEIDPPAPPPAPVTPAAPAPVSTAPPGPPSALDRYQDCFQQMIDSGANDNNFMRQCLGLEEQKPADSMSKSFSRDDAAAVIEASLKSLETCYNLLLERSQALHLIPEGVIDPVLSVDEKGSVTKVNFEPTQFMDVGLLECIQKKMLSFNFKKAPSDTVIKMSLRFNVTGTKRVGRVSLMKGYPRLSGPAYELSSKDVLAVFQKYSPRVRACYDELLKKSPKAGGTVAVNLVINSIGKVRKVIFRENTISDRKFRNCITTQLKTFRFPKPAGEDDAVVKYPAFVFSPKKG